MSWSKLKTIIILILLLLNLFLLALVGVNQIRSARYQATALSEAAAVLELNGIHVERDNLPACMELTAATAARDTRREGELAALLLGDDVQASASGGGLYVYDSAAGTANFRSSGEFSVAFSQPVPAGEDRTAAARSLLERLGVSVGQVSGDGNTVTAAQAVTGVPVFSSGVTSSASSAAGVTFVYNTQGQLISVSGRLLLGAVSSDPDAPEPLDTPTMLIAFFNFIVENGDVCQSILEMTPVYRASALSDPVRLTPAWHIITDTGDYFLDACTGEAIRAAAE